MVATDGPNGVFVPVSGADFVTLGLPAPGFLWLCQEASGNLAATIGGITLTATGAAGHLYQQSVSGWTRKFIGTVDGAAEQRWSSGVQAALAFAAGESVAMLVLAAIATGGVRDIYGVNDGTNGNRWRFLTNGVIQGTHGNLIGKSSAASYSDLTRVRALLWYRDATGKRSGTMTDTEHIPAVHYEGAVSGQSTSVGSSRYGTACDTRTGLVAIWKGADAETIAHKATFTALGWAPSWNETVMQDGPSNVYVPQGPSDFAALGLPAPDFLWGCQEASGSLVPAIGNPAVVLANSGGAGYQNTMSGWNRKALVTTDGVSQGFFTTDAALDLAAGESYAVIAFGAVNSAGARCFLTAQGSSDRMFLNLDNTVYSYHNGQGALLAGAYDSSGVIHPWVWFRDAAANISGGKSDLSDGTATHNESARTGEQRGIGSTVDAAATTRFCWYAVYKGVNAEGRDWYNYLRILNWIITGEVAATLAGATLSATAATAIAAQAAITLADASLVATTTTAIAAQSAVTLDNAIAVGVAADPIAVQVSSTLRDDALLASATADIAAQTAATLANASFVATAKLDIAASLAVTLANAAGASAAAVPLAGQSAGSLDNATSVITAKVAIAATTYNEDDDSNIQLEYARATHPSIGGQASGYGGGWSDDLQGSFQ
jgi:hypothetical protein